MHKHNCWDTDKETFQDKHRSHLTTEITKFTESDSLNFVLSVSSVVIISRLQVDLSQLYAAVASTLIPLSSGMTFSANSCMLFAVYSRGALPTEKLAISKPKPTFLAYSSRR